jgi:hypothetical protein
MLAVDPANPEWRKSSFSGANGGSGCIEVAALHSGGIAVRDTKDRALPPHHHSARAWSEFLAGIRAGEFGS